MVKSRQCMYVRLPSRNFSQLVCDTLDTFHNNKCQREQAYYTGIGQKAPESHNKMMSKVTGQDCAANDSIFKNSGAESYGGRNGNRGGLDGTDLLTDMGAGFRGCWKRSLS